MTSKDSVSTRARPPLASIVPAVLALALGGLGQAYAADAPLPAQLSGLLNDYTPAPPTLSTGPYEMHGRWSLRLGAHGSATFAAEMTMALTDFTNAASTYDPTKLGTHTHHISVTDGVVHRDPTDPINWQASCPPFKIPVTGGFVVTGTAYVAGNGGNAPFGNPSAVTICILGGTPNAAVTTPQAIVEYSNLTLSFATGSPASTHFGTQPINGVVARCQGPWDSGSEACRVSVVE